MQPKLLLRVMHANIYLMHAFNGKDGDISSGAVLTKGMDMKEVPYVWHGVSIEKKDKDSRKRTG